jgi:hypothetical protein
MAGTSPAMTMDGLVLRRSRFQFLPPTGYNPAHE